MCTWSICIDIAWPANTHGANTVCRWNATTIPGKWHDQWSRHKVKVLNSHVLHYDHPYQYRVWERGSEHQRRENLLNHSYDDWRYDSHDIRLSVVIVVINVSDAWFGELQPSCQPPYLVISRQSWCGCIKAQRRCSRRHGPSTTS